MSVFMIETDGVDSSSSNLSTISSKISSLCDSVNSYDVSCDDGFDFSSAKSVISNNLEACLIKIKNTSKILETVSSSHKYLQESLKFGEDEDESSISYRQNSNDGSYYSGNSYSTGYSGSDGSSNSNGSSYDDVSENVVEQVEDDTINIADFTETKEFSTTVQFNLNGGEGSYDTFSLKDGETANLPTPTRDGYEFLGWSTSLTGPGLVFGSVMSTSLLTNSDTTLYAMWKKSGEADSTAQGFQYSSTDKKWYYYNEDGNKVTGEVEVDGKKYYLDDETGEVTYGWMTTSDGKKVFYNEYGERMTGGSYLPDSSGSSSERSFYCFNSETGEATKVYDVGGWDYENWEYVASMKERAIANGSDTGWYVVVDCSAPTKVTVFNYQDGEWNPVAGWHCVTGMWTDAGGSSSIPGLHKIGYKAESVDGYPGLTVGYVDVWRDDGTYNGAAFHGRVEGQGNADSSMWGYGNGSCVSLTDENIKWLYDNIPEGTTVDVTGDCVGLTGSRIESPTGHDYILDQHPYGQTLGV